MTATALISGKIFKEPERRTSKAGKPFVMATLREGDGEAVTWWKVFAFGDTAADELASLHEGDGVAVSGGFKVETYDKGGEARLSYTIFADRLISTKRQRRERDQERRTERKAEAVGDHRGHDPDDRLPF